MINLISTWNAITSLSAITLFQTFYWERDSKKPIQHNKNIFLLFLGYFYAEKVNRFMHYTNCILINAFSLILRQTTIAIIS